MQEKFDLNIKSVPGEGYRKNLSEELKSLTTEEAQEKLLTEQNEKKENQYEKEKIEQRALWIVDKYFSEPGMFKMDEVLSLEQRQEKIDEIFNKKIKELNEEEKGVVDSLKEKTYTLASRIIKERDIENNPNLEHLRGEHSDIILQKKGQNKFILIALQDNNLDRNIFFDIAIAADNKSGLATEKYVLDALKDLSSQFKDEESKNEYFTNMIFRDSVKNKIIIARPMDNEIFNQHYQLNNKFKREHKDYKEDSRSCDGYEVDDFSLLFGKEKNKEIKDFVKRFIEIIENETDYNIAMEKLKNLPKPTDLKPTYSVLGGGYMGFENKKLWVGGNSEKYGYLFERDHRQTGLQDTLKKDFPKKEIDYVE